MPEIRIAVSNNSSFAGDMSTLLCSVAAPPFDFIIAPVLTWRGPGVNQNSVQLSSVNILSLMLIFNPLHTSHGGVYTCEATFNASQVDISSTSVNVIVQSEFLFCASSSHLLSCITLYSSNSRGVHSRTSHSLQWNNLHT